jgi:predicted TIM-barrel fold metal-dependent hydrolase
MGGAAVLVDVHTHCLKPEHWGREFNDHWKPKFGHDYPDISPAAFDAAMSEAGVDVAIVFGLTAVAAGVRTPHDFVASFCQQTAVRTIGFMALDPADGDVLEQVEEGVSLGLKGVKLYPVLAGFSPVEEPVQPLLDLLEKRRLVVLWHMGANPSPVSDLRLSEPLLIDAVARRHPDLRQIIAHMGHPWQRDTVQVLRSNRFVYSDVSGLWSRSWDGYNALRNAIEWDVTDKLLFGSDFPFWTPKEAVEGLRAMPQLFGPPLPELDPGVLEQILNRDSLELLGLEPT